MQSYLVVHKIPYVLKELMGQSYNFCEGFRDETLVEINQLLFHRQNFHSTSVRRTMGAASNFLSEDHA